MLHLIIHPTCDKQPEIDYISDGHHRLSVQQILQTTTASCEWQLIPEYQFIAEIACLFRRFARFTRVENLSDRMRA